MAEKYKVAVKSKNQLTHKIWQLDLKLVEPAQVQFKAGQCVSFHVADKEQRLYSIITTPSTAPENNNELSFCADISPMGYGSKFILALNAGDEFEFDGPHGFFSVTPEKDFGRDLLFVATGAGVAPFVSIIADALEKGFSNKATLIFGVREESDLFYADYFQDLAKRYPNFEFIPTLSQPKGEWAGQRGRVTAILAESGDKYAGRLAYLCGSLNMIKDARAALIAKNFSMRDIKLENFG